MRGDVGLIEPSYPLARSVAPALHDRLSSLHEEDELEDGLERAPLADPGVIERLIEAGFWASLRSEEGRTPKISLAFVPPEMAGHALTFGRRLPLAPMVLTRLAPAVERPGIHLCVWRDEDDDVYVWGASRSIPNLCFVLEVFEPALLVAKYRRREEFAKFGNLAVLEGDRVRVIDERSARRRECPDLLAALAGLECSSAGAADLDVRIQLALSMRAHRHGGTLLIVPSDSEWHRSIVSPISYRSVPPFSRLADLLERLPDEIDRSRLLDELRPAVDGVAGLTAVDGATIMNERYEVLAFGAKIKRADGGVSVEEVVVMEPVIGYRPSVIEAAEVGGTRHLSAAQFVHDQRDALALVASQDGRFTIFLWSDAEQRVHAHRIETLLM